MSRFIVVALAVALTFVANGSFISSARAEEAGEQQPAKKNPLQLLGTAPIEKNATGTQTKVEATNALFGRRSFGGFRSGGGYYGYPSYYGNYGVRQYGYGYPGVGTAYYDPVHGNFHTNHGGGYGYGGNYGNYGSGNYGNSGGGYGGSPNYNNYSNYGSSGGGYGNYGGNNYNRQGTGRTY